MSLFGVILVRISPVFYHIRTEYGEILYSVRIVFSPNAGKCGENADLNNSEYGHFLRSEDFWKNFKTYLSKHAFKQSRQKRCPHAVWTGFRKMKLQMEHS